MAQEKVSKNHCESEGQDSPGENKQHIQDKTEGQGSIGENNNVTEEQDSCGNRNPEVEGEYSQEDQSVTSQTAKIMWSRSGPYIRKSAKRTWAGVFWHNGPYRHTSGFPSSGPALGQLRTTLGPDPQRVVRAGSI
ncbi:hypothetical protein QQF64_014664 [Cirrhinus molitorella]|uniref:Uncharacterized protein n=1 Tax=Cirrhinus molitorella TaxID=172907 RepID=A0ABR3NSS3_9TELE